MKTLPIVNINGNSRESLVNEAIAIRNALEVVQKLIAESDLANQRNFQTAEPGAYFVAREEKAEEYRWLDAKADEYLKLAIALQG
jgi:hypothetical protein